MSVRVAITADVKQFAERVQPHYQYGKLSVTTGKVYHKIVSTVMHNGQETDQRSVYGFVDMQGNIYKAAGWAKPAKNVRGNIFSDQGGLEAIDAQGFVRYLR